MVQPKETAWETETGLPNDIDATISNPRFGTKDEYAQAVRAQGAEGTMFIVDLLGDGGELLGSQGWSIGTGWIIADDGKSISHPKRKHVVGSSMYGQLQNRVVKELGLDMDQYGLPTQATSWDGLKFHWLQEEHETVSGDKRTSLMPTEFQGKTGVAAPAKAAAPVSAVETNLIAVAKANSLKDFQKLALRNPAVVGSDDLMASVLDDGPEGFWAKNQEK